MVTCEQANFDPFDEESPSETVLANNVITVGGSRMQVTHTTNGSATISSNRIDDNYFPGEIGIHIRQPNTANSLANSIVSEYTFSENITDFTFRLQDIDAGDHIIVDAYDENNNIINITSSNYAFYPSTFVTFDGSNQFSAGAYDSSVGARNGTVDFDYDSAIVSKIVFTFYDISAAGGYDFTQVNGCEVLAQFPDATTNDDDGDGILNVDEGLVECPEPNPSITGLTIEPSTIGSPADLFDGNTNQTVFYFFDNQPYNTLRDEIFTIDLSAPAVLTQIRVLLQTEPGFGNISFLGEDLQYKAQGFNGTSWIDIRGSTATSDG